MLLKLRVDRRLSQEALAERIFAARQDGSRWENGETVSNTGARLRSARSIWRTKADLLIRRAPAPEPDGLRSVTRGSTDQAEKDMTLFIKLFNDALA